VDKFLLAPEKKIPCQRLPDINVDRKGLPGIRDRSSDRSVSDDTLL